MTMLFCIAESEIKVIHTYIHTHTGEKTDQCEICDAKFSRIDNLNV